MYRFFLFGSLSRQSWMVSCLETLKLMNFWPKMEDVQLWHITMTPLFSRFISFGLSVGRSYCVCQSYINCTNCHFFCSSNDRPKAARNCFRRASQMKSSWLWQWPCAASLSCGSYIWGELGLGSCAKTICTYMYTQYGYTHIIKTYMIMYTCKYSMTHTQTHTHTYI